MQRCARRYAPPMLSAADPPAVVWINFVVVVLAAGLISSFLCVVLERRLVGEVPTGRSHCICGAQIPMVRNIPVASWVLQGGKAHCCGARIPAWYVVAEAGFMVAAAVGAATAWPHALIGGAIAIALSAAALTVWHTRQHRT